MASAFIHGILLLVSVMTIPAVLNLIPLASLAAVLFLVGYKLAKPSLFRIMYGRGQAEFIPFIVTILGIIFTDLLIGIGMGMVVAIFYILWNNFKTPYHFDVNDYAEGQPIRIELSEDVSFLNKVSIQRTLEQIPDGATLIIDGSRAKTIHPDIIEIIGDFQSKSEGKNIHLELESVYDKGKYNPVQEFSTAVGPNLNK